MGKFVYLKLYQSDWRGSPHVRAMSLAQRGLYIEMLMLSWERGAIPSPCTKAGRSKLSILLSIPEGEIQQLWKGTLPLCWELDADAMRTHSGRIRWCVNPRLEKERQRAQSRSDSASRSALSRWKQTPGSCERNADGMLSIAIASTSTHANRDTSASDQPKSPLNRVSKGAKPPREPKVQRDLIPPGIQWKKTHTCPEGEVQMDKQFRAWLIQQVNKDYAAWLDEFLPSSANGVELSLGELQESLRNLNTHLVANPHKTNKRSLPSITVGWFKTDLKRKRERLGRSRPSKTEGIREWLREKAEQNDLPK